MSDIDLERVEKLINMMIENDLTELHLEQGDTRIELKRGCGLQNSQPSPPLTASIPLAPANQAAQAPPPPEDEHAGLTPIDSPMVGTLYRAPNPESPSFVKVGSIVDKDTTVCLIEAMKVFNEIKADVEGTIEKIMVNDTDAVEYGQALFYVRPK